MPVLLRELYATCGQKELYPENDICPTLLTSRELTAAVGHSKNVSEDDDNESEYHLFF